MTSVGIIGVGAYVPPKIFKNTDFKDIGIETSDEWIIERTGIRERRICTDDIATSDLAYEASLKALEHANVKPQDIGLIIVATSTPDYLSFPSTACLLQDRLGASTIGAFDLSAACTGFNYALTTGAQFIKSGFCKHVLVVGAESMSRIVDWKDRRTCILFGDGAGAVVLGAVEEGYGILGSDLHANGEHADLLRIRGGGSRFPLNETRFKDREYFVDMNGKAVFKVAVTILVPSILNALKKAGVSKEELSLLVPHQANLRIIEAARKKLGLAKSQVFCNLERYGNTSAASIPLALYEAVKEGKITDGDILALAGFGAGFTWGSNIIRWRGPL